MIGASYKFNDAFSGAFYASDVEDVLKRQYLNLNYVLPIASNSLTFDFNGYRTKQDADFQPARAASGAWPRPTRPALACLHAGLPAQQWRHRPQLRLLPERGMDR